MNTLPRLAAAAAPPLAAVAPAPLRGLAAAAAAAGELGVPSFPRSSARSLLLRPTGSKFFSFAAASRVDARLSPGLPDGPAAAAAAAADPSAAVPDGPGTAAAATALGDAEVSSSLQDESKQS